MHQPATAARTDGSTMHRLIERWREDPFGSYRSWFLWEERLKNFRAIRRGLAKVVEEIADGSFGCVYKGSSLEVVVGSIAEQRQVFKGADHAFLWKPKLRIPDIYENLANQREFGRFLDHCCCCTAEADIVAAIRRLDACAIKGLGPATANLLYFLHPTFMPPFNTAIVKGYNLLTDSRVRLGRWDEYLAMRDGILRINTELRDLLSNDLGAVGGLLFDIGVNRYAAPPPVDNATAHAAWEADLAHVREEGAKERKLREAAQAGDHTHTQIQGWLRDLGRALGFEVWVAQNDRGRPFGNGRLGDDCLDALPTALAAAPGSDAVRLIDVLWLDRTEFRVAAAFEVEHSTSIYSGIVRLLDLALGSPQEATRGLFLVAPDDREADVRVQLRRPAFSRVTDLGVRYLSYGDLAQHREAMSRFGSGLKAIEAIARSL